MSKIKLVSVETDTARPLTVDDAKRVQRLVEHLQVLRKHRDFLADKRARATRVGLRVCLSEQEVPPEVRRGQCSHANGVSYSRDSDEGWFVNHSLEHGSLDDGRWGYGRLPTIDTRVMDGVRAAVADEIEATENAITALGFAVPK